MEASGLLINFKGFTIVIVTRMDVRLCPEVDNEQLATNQAKEPKILWLWTFNILMLINHGSSSQSIRFVESLGQLWLFSLGTLIHM